MSAGPCPFSDRISSTDDAVMEYENVFRLVMILGFGVVFPVGLYHRIKAQASGEKLNRRAEGMFILLTLRPIALIRLLGVLAWLVNPPWMRWSSMPLPMGIRWCGVGVGVSAAVFLIIVLNTLGPNITDTVVTRERHTLVTVGPYRWVRHPFYVATALALVADSLVTANWFLAGTGLLTIVLLLIRTGIEEEKLVARFGQQYTEYARHTGRFIPRLTRSDGPRR